MSTIIVHMQLNASKIWEVRMRNVIAACAVFLSICTAHGAEDSFEFYHDLDEDGVSDKIVIERSQLSDDTDGVRGRLKITFSTKAQPVDVEIWVDLNEFYANSWYNIPGYFVIGYAPGVGLKEDFHHEVYRWEDEYKKLCLFADIEGKLEPSIGRILSKNVMIYNKCIAIGDHASTSKGEQYYRDFNISASILLDKAWLYNSPNVKNVSKMYLIKDDQIIVKNYKYANGEDWFLVRYLPSGRDVPIVKWVNGMSIEPRIFSRKE